MSNFSISLDLKKLKNAFVKDFQGQTGAKKCLVIPIEDAGLKEYKDSLYLNLTATESKNNNFGQSHTIKAQIAKEKYFAMTKEERFSIPYLGNMKPQGNYNNNQGNNNNNNRGGYNSSDDLPY